jgi:proteic killer suppression protein
LTRHYDEITINVVISGGAHGDIQGNSNRSVASGKPRSTVAVYEKPKPSLQKQPTGHGLGLLKKCKVSLDTLSVRQHLTNIIKSIRHKALGNYWTKGQKKGLNANWVPRISRIPRALDVATEAEEMNFPGYYFHRLSGKDADRYSVRVIGNYRITFGWADNDAIDIDLEDYH